MRDCSDKRCADVSLLRPSWIGVAIREQYGDHRRLIITDGTLEALKWIALVAMTADHINKYLLASQYPWMYEFGRLAMPLFAFVLGYNLARPRAALDGLYLRALCNMLCFGMLATPFFMMMQPVSLLGSWYPLNIMFMLLSATLVIFLYEKTHRIAALLAFLLLGAVVEYWWIGIACCIGAWWFCRQPGLTSLLFWISVLSGLTLVNGNMWALAVLPIVLMARYLQVDIHRIRYVFYSYYPVHLAVIWIATFWL